MFFEVISKKVNNFIVYDNMTRLECKKVYLNQIHIHKY